MVYINYIIGNHSLVKYIDVKKLEKDLLSL